MKATILSINVINSAALNMTVSLSQDNGIPIITKTFGIVSTESDPLTCLNYLKQSFLNVGNQYLTENGALTYYVSNSLIGHIIQL